jgi:predicted nucleic acid-binding protein
MIYCIDSNIIIWGIKKQASKGQEEMIARAEQIFAKADELEDYILIPTVALSEILAPELPHIRAKYLEIFKKSFIVAPFDERAALKYAEIMHERFEEVKDLAASTNTPRQKTKVDHMIIATALVHGATAIYSTDEGLRKFAKGLIDVRDVPPLKQVIQVQSIHQNTLFADILPPPENKPK